MTTIPLLHLLRFYKGILYIRVRMECSWREVIFSLLSLSHGWDAYLSHNHVICAWHASDLGYEVACSLRQLIGSSVVGYHCVSVHWQVTTVWVTLVCHHYCLVVGSGSLLVSLDLCHGGQPHPTGARLRRKSYLVFVAFSTGVECGAVHCTVHLQLAWALVGLKISMVCGFPEAYALNLVLTKKSA